MGKWVIDTDGGIDDAQAIILALTTGKAYDFEVVGVTVVAGNVDVDKVSRNVRECLRVCHSAHIPCYIGASRPLVDRPMDATYFHGADGLGGYWCKVPPAPPLPPPSPEPAYSALLRLANTFPGELNIVTIGPLTNLAMAVSLDPLLPQKVGRLVVMGCSETGNGNTGIATEFNIAWDPEAACIVFDRFDRVEVVTWEGTIDPRNEVPAEVMRKYLHGGSETGRFLSMCTSPEKKILCDPMALAVAIDPSIVLAQSEGELFVNLDGSYARGRTFFDRKAQRKNAVLAEVLDMKRFCEMIMRSVD